MASLKNTHAPASAAGFTWDTPDDVVAVPDDVASELLAIPDAGFVEVADKPKKKVAVTEPDPDAAK